MKRKVVWLVVSCLMVLALLATSCAKAEEKAPAAKEAAPAVKEAAPAVKEAAPAVKEAAPSAEPEKIRVTLTKADGTVVTVKNTPVVREAAPDGMIKVTLTKVDGTVVEKLSEKPKYGGVFIYAKEAPIMAWDEAFMSPWIISDSVGNLVNEDLTQGDWTISPTGTGELSWQLGGFFQWDRVGMSLAESFEIPDNATIIFHIRKGVHWALNPKSEASRLVGGRELKASDVVFNIRRIYIDIKTSVMYGMTGASNPTDVYATDDYTVVVKSAPGQIGQTLEAVGSLCMMVPPEVVKKYGDMNQWETVVGTGPFMLTDYVPMSSATYIRNPNYWMHDPILGEEYPLPYADGYKILIIPDFSTRLSAMRTGKVDKVSDTYKLTDARPLMKSNPGLKYIKYLGSWGGLLTGRVDKPELPFKDIRVRRAIMMAMNNQEMIDNIFEGDTWPGLVSGFKVMAYQEFRNLGWYTPLEELPPSPDGFDNKKLYTYHPDEAKKLLAEAGYPNGFKTDAVLQCIADQVDQTLIAKAYLADIAIDLTLSIKEPSVYQNMRVNKTFSEMFISTRGTLDPYSMYCVRPGNIYNYTMNTDPKITQYYDDITNAYFDLPKRNALMREMNQYAISQAYYWKPPSPYVYAFWQPWLKNYQGENNAGKWDSLAYVKYIWIDQELKKAIGY